MSYSLVYITTPSEQEARALGRALVEARLAASANVLPGISSFYWWDGAIREGPEAVLIAKTREALVARAIELVRQRHSYVCPCVIALPIQAGSPAYLDWIDVETAAD